MKQMPNMTPPSAGPTMQEFAKQVGPGMMMDVGREALRLMLKEQQTIPVISESGDEIRMPVTRTGMGPLQTEFGQFWHARFQTSDKWGDYHALIACETMDIRTGTPQFKKNQELLVRTDSGCITGQVFHDMTCDCRQQLHQAMTEVSNRGEGIIVHIPGQDGRGMGLDFKLATMHIQQRLGANTVQAGCIIRFMDEVHRSITELSQLAEFDQIQDVVRRVLDIEEEAENLWDHGKPELAMDKLNNTQADVALIVEKTRRDLKVTDIDQRTYEGVVAVVKALGVQPDISIQLATNNPHKLEVFQRNHYTVRNSPVIASNAGDIAKHLLAKAQHLGHEIPPEIVAE